MDDVYDKAVKRHKEIIMKSSGKKALLAIVACMGVVAFFGVACGSDEVNIPESDHTDVQPPSGTAMYMQTADTGWKAYAVAKGVDEGAELHLENSGKHVLLPDAAPLGFSPDGKYLLLVWMNGLAVIDMDEPEKPRPLADASKISTPGRPEDIRWSGHRLEYDLLGESDRLTVMADLDSKVVTTRPME